MLIGDKKIYNKSISLYEKLSDEINRDWDSIMLCSAFLSDSAAKSLIELIEDIDDRELKITIMIGIKNNFTSPSAIEILINYINTCNKPNLEFNLRLPMDRDFHLKVYVFKNEDASKAIIGSANLTDTGLKSIGELMIDINNEKDINKITECLSNYLRDSELWIDCIEEYEKRYEKNKPNIITSDTDNLKKQNHLNKKKIVLQKRRPKRLDKFSKKTGPTIETLGSISKACNSRVKDTFNKVQETSENINSGNAIIYFDYSEEYIKNRYPIGSYFDRPTRGDNQSWNIGDKRSICEVGAIGKTVEDEVVIFMKRGCMHYTVTQDIINMAEELGIKQKEEHEECIPSQNHMDRYRKFIKEHR